MKTEFQVKLLQHMVRKKENQGFTLIELLVVIIIIGILAAIALPSFLNQANKAKQAEAKTNIGSLNRAQQAYYLEKNEFANQSNFGNLGLGIKTTTVNYNYSIVDGGANSSAVSNLAKTVNANAPLKDYVGAVNVGTVTTTSEATTLAVLCEADKPKSAGGATAVAGTYAQTGPTCPAGFSPL
ncbi:MAG TPA: type IV pilin-like G/H family protein [Coleofasciculaceae cyanobacterium]